MAAIYTETVLQRKPHYDKMGIPPFRRKMHYMPMGYLDALKALRKRKGMTQVELAEKIGVEQATIQRWEAGKREPDIAALHKIASVLGVSAGSLVNGDALLESGPRLYIKGVVQAGLWRPAIEMARDEWEPFIGRSDVTADPEHRFGLRVMGDSMDLLYPEGTVLECVSLFGRAEAAPGKRVIVIRKDGDGNCEATVKELVEREGELWAYPRSTNPVHLPIRICNADPGIAEVRIAAIVVASVRPE
jgi:transcriptional regulator with XRE-family HTH domain